jgi:hypothetical protein
MADQTPTPPIPPVTTPTEPGRIVHTYRDDLANAMNVTEVDVVQELLETARTREASEKERETIRKQRGWYTTGGLILVLLALGALAYGVYYYNNLTVPVVQTASVGVFQSTEAIYIDQTDSTIALAALTDPLVLTENKPLLVPLFSNTTTRTPLSVAETLQYLGMNASEPFVASVSLARLGMYNDGTRVSPFIIFSVTNPEIASKEFLIAEPTFLEQLSKVLMIDTSNQALEVGTSFTSTYMYNLPVRTLTAVDLDTKERTIVLYYGYATDRTIVLASNPMVLKSVYNTIIQQR